MFLKGESTRVSLYLPPELKAWVEEQARKNWSSQNSEIVRCILRARTEAEQRAAG
jgi:hypothetical protein